MTSIRPLPRPRVGDEVAWVAAHLGHLVRDTPGSHRPARHGGQSHAARALAELDLTGYSRRRSLVDPPAGRGATVLSPYIRHGLLTLPEVVSAAGQAAGTATDRRRFIDELWWQEYCRHLYARAGAATRQPLRRQPAVGSPPWPHPAPDAMNCMRHVTEELEATGWIVNQTRMWVPSQWTVRAGHDWGAGEDWMFAHLLDGSRAANRFGWQWAIGAMTSKPYGFSRWQVSRRASAWCASCALNSECPISGWPKARSGDKLDSAWLSAGEDLDGPTDASHDAPPREPAAVWLTAESLGHCDPALAAWPDLPAIFVFDEPLLAGLRLSAKRLVFLTETLAELAEHRPLVTTLGDPVDVLRGTPLAVTHAPVPGFQRRAAALEVVAVHPYPWRSRPDGGDVASHAAWIRRHRRSAAPSTAQPAASAPTKRGKQR